MEPRLTDSLSVVFILSILLSTEAHPCVGSSESDRDLKFCGIWRHGKNLLSLSVNLSTGCEEILISANTSSLSIDGKITGECQQSDVFLPGQFGLDSEEEIKFCLHWEPLLDHFRLQLGETTLNLCKPSSLQPRCCTYLSDSSSEPEAPFGIINGTVRTDFITNKTRSAYKFKGERKDCKELCAEEINGTTQASMIKEEHPCTRSIEVEMKEDFRGSNVTSPVTIGTSEEPTITVYIPPALKEAAKWTNKVNCTFFENISLFQEGQKKNMILSSVVEITMKNEVIVDLSEPIKIGFHHDPLPKKHSRRCVSWDTRKDPYQVNWLVDGCVTQQKGEEHTECFCNHLTYFTVLVQMEPRPVRHLLALTVITSVGCIVSAISCVALIIFLYRKRRSQEQSIPIHLGLAVSLLLLSLLFFFTGILANMGVEGLCTWVGAGLHYALLSSFSWMGIEVFHTFWLVYMVFSPLPKGIWKLWSLVGFGLPAVPVIILAAVGNIYGLREVVPSDDVSNPYLMCWMTVTYKALLAHYFTTMTILVILVSSGIVMLFLVYRKIHTRDEWRQSRVAFLSIWGLSCLFGTTWGLTFLDFGPLSDFVLFLSCILNSFQGFLLMLRFYMLEWIRKQAGGSALGSNSTASTRQQMLQAQEKS